MGHLDLDPSEGSLLRFDSPEPEMILIPGIINIAGQKFLGDRQGRKGQGSRPQIGIRAEIPLKRATKKVIFQIFQKILRGALGKTWPGSVVERQQKDHRPQRDQDIAQGQRVDYSHCRLSKRSSGKQRNTLPAQPDTTVEGIHAALF